jgi:hypothetical protein
VVTSSRVCIYINNIHIWGSTSRAPVVVVCVLLWWPYTYFLGRSWPSSSSSCSAASSVRPCPVVGSCCLGCDVSAVCLSLSWFPFRTRSLAVKYFLVKYIYKARKKNNIHGARWALRGPMTISLNVVARSGHVLENFENRTLSNPDKIAQNLQNVVVNNRTDFANTSKVVVKNGHTENWQKKYISSESNLCALSGFRVQSLATIHMQTHLVVCFSY